MFRASRKSLPDFFLSQNIEVKPAKHGLGVFAKRDIKRLEMIESCPVIIFDCATSSHLYDLHNHRHVLMDYPFAWEKGYIALAHGYGGLYNHSSLLMNVTWRPNFKVRSLEFTAVRDIAAGEELLVRYCNIHDNSRLWFVSEEEEEEDSRAAAGEDLLHPGGCWSPSMNSSNSSHDMVEKALIGGQSMSGSLRHMP